MRAPASGFCRAVLLAQRHQAGHFLLGETQFFASELGKRQILHFERLAAGGFGGGEGMKCRGCGGHMFVLLIARGTHPARLCLRRFGGSAWLHRLQLSARFRSCDK